MCSSILSTSLMDKRRNIRIRKVVGDAFILRLPTGQRLRSEVDSQYLRSVIHLINITTPQFVASILYQAKATKSQLSLWHWALFLLLEPRKDIKAKAKATPNKFSVSCPPLHPLILPALKVALLAMHSFTYYFTFILYRFSKYYSCDVKDESISWKCF